MSPSPPTPPTDLPDEVTEAIEDLSPERLREVARYVEQLAAYREHETDSSEEDSDAPSSETDDRPEEVPAKATLTVKEINDNRYYYWQWREGDKIKSKYHAPVNGGS